MGLRRPDGAPSRGICRHGVTFDRADMIHGEGQCTLGTRVADSDVSEVYALPLATLGLSKHPSGEALRDRSMI